VPKDRESSALQSKWLACVASLPTDDPAARMRALRTLESLGCAVLREGVYLLPDSPAGRQGLARLVEHMARIDGSAHLLSISSLDEAQSEAFRGLFDRSAKYEQLTKTVLGLAAGFGVSDPGSIARVLNKQQREFGAISSLDFFPSPAREIAARALREIGEQVRAIMFPDAPDATPLSRSGRHYFKRLWATRRPLWDDRLASAWLVRRFIDPEATLIWLEPHQVCPVAAIGFGFEGANFFNTRSSVTFEALLAAFGLNQNASLARLGALVHFLAAGGPPVAEAAGVETLLQGARRRSNSDDELLLESEKTFDLLYEAYCEPAAKA
jgi:hypothetical protein